jgi:hypothetical protein
MGLLSKTKKPKAAKVPKVICPSCGKPNPGESELAVRRCVLCNGILPAPMALTPGLGGAPEAPAPAVAAPTPDVPETAADWGTGGSENFDAGALQYTQFAKAPQGRTGLADAAPADTFDFGALQVGEPALPRPSAND